MATAIDAATKPLSPTPEHKAPRLHSGFVASVSIIRMACKPWREFQSCVMGAKFLAKAWSKASAARPRKACMGLKGLLRQQPAKDNPSCRDSRIGRLVCDSILAKTPKREHAALLHLLDRNRSATGAVPCLT
jgi:hypothetical protein